MILETWAACARRGEAARQDGARGNGDGDDHGRATDEAGGSIVRAVWMGFVTGTRASQPRRRAISFFYLVEHVSRRTRN